LASFISKTKGCILKRNKYEIRQKSLKRLGFDSYKDYLESDLWLKIKKKVYLFGKGKCRYCGEKANIPHHLKYDYLTLSGKKRQIKKNIVLICRKCHELEHKVEIQEWKKSKNISNHIKKEEQLQKQHLLNIKDEIQPVKGMTKKPSPGELIKSSRKGSAFGVQPGNNHDNITGRSTVGVTAAKAKNQKSACDVLKVDNKRLSPLNKSISLVSYTALS
jgi:5-methylcytosine-specific restriction endonuclease McrA